MHQILFVVIRKDCYTTARAVSRNSGSLVSFRLHLTLSFLEQNVIKSSLNILI